MNLEGSCPFRDLMVVLFRHFDESGVPYLVLRNYEHLPDKTSNDVDMLVAPSRLSDARRAVVEAAEEAGWNLSNVGRFACLSLFLCRLDTGAQVHIDLMPGNRWHSVRFVDDEAVLSRRRPFRCFFIPAPGDEAWIGLATRLLYGGYVKERYRPIIQSACKNDTEQSLLSFRSFLGRNLAEKVVELCARGEWNSIERMVRRIRLRVLWANALHPTSFIGDIATDAKRLIVRLVNPPGLQISIVGEDALWCDAVSMQLAQGLSGTFSPKRTVQRKSGGKSVRKRFSDWKNSFHGGLTILDYGSVPVRWSKSDIVVSDGSTKAEINTIVLPQGQRGIDVAVVEILRFLVGRNAHRHA